MTATLRTAFELSDDRIKVVAKISDDKLKLFVDAEPLAQTGNGAIGRDELVALLGQHVPVDTINVGVIDDIVTRLNAGEKVEERRVIKGVEPKAGADGKLVFLVKRFTGSPEVSVDEKGFAQFRELNLFENVKVGTAIARLYAPKAGEDGVDVFGKKIIAPSGKPCKVKLDKTLLLVSAPEGGDSYQVIESQVEGYVAEDKGSISVRQELVISGNVDFHIGNIDYIGSVRIKGDVLPGFTVQAKKGIVVQGSVRGAVLRSSEGDIEVKGFVHGGEGGKIVCGREVRAHVLQQILVEALSNIVVKKEAIDCQLRTQSALLIDAGSLVGGETLAVCGVEVKCLGNEVGRKTEIQLVSDTEMSTEFVTMKANIESHDKAIKLMELHLGPYVRTPDRIALLNEPHRSKLTQLLRKYREVQESRVKLLSKRQTLLKGARINSVLRINFLGDMFEEVYVRAGEDVYRCTTRAKGPASLDYHPREHRFELGEYKGLECTVMQSQPVNSDGGN